MGMVGRADGCAASIHVVDDRRSLDELQEHREAEQVDDGKPDHAGVSDCPRHADSHALRVS